MTVDIDFVRDTEFCKLLARREDVTLTRVALELARDEQPQLEFSETLEWIELRAAELRSHLLKVRSDRDMLKELVRCLAGTHGLHGSKNAFERAECSYLNRVIETGVGIPISLSVVYVAVAQAAGLDLTCVAAPMHFLTRFDSLEGPLFVDAFYEGQVLGYDDCLGWIESMTGLPSEEIERTLKPARPRDVIIRMLNNLKTLHLNQDKWEPAWLVQRRLFALAPQSFEHRRDLALIAIKTDRCGVAVDLLQACLKDGPVKERSVLQGHLRVAERNLSKWN